MKNKERRFKDAYPNFCHAGVKFIRKQRKNIKFHPHASTIPSRTAIAAIVLQLGFARGFYSFRCWQFA